MDIVARYAFAYKALTDDDIRLVTILPAPDFNDPIQCSLRHVSLENPPAYEALSYTWGDQSVTKPINLEGETIEVTDNLESALRHLRLPQTMRQLWVDALCINQHNILERNVQLGRMNQIYSKPQRVIVWLGPETYGSTKAITKLLELSRTEQFEDWPSFYGSLTSPHDPAVWEAIRKLFNRPWWNRIWVIQEVIASAEVSFVCGTISITFEELEKAVHLIAPLWLALRDIEGNESLSTSRIDQLFLLSKTKNQRSAGSTVVPPLQELLQRFRYKEATDPRDKVYALLNLVDFRQDLEYLLRPDYALTVEDVYIRVAKYIISEQGNLNLFEHCLHSDLNLPSWVPPWNFQRKSSVPVLKRSLPNQQSGPNLPLYSSDGKRPIEVRFENRDRITVLRGINIDKIAELGEICDDFVGDTWSGLPYWLLMAMSSGTIYKSVDEKLLAFKSTITFDTHRDANGIWRGPRSKFPLPIDSEDPENIWDKATAKVMIDRRFAITSGGLMGLVPSSTRIGDVVGVLYGGEVPYILRSCPNAPSNFQLIGECYIHGMMDGQVIEDLDNGLHKEDVFRII